MAHELQFYVNGEWVDPATPRTLDVIDPSTAKPFEVISVGSASDVDRAVAAAKAALRGFSRSKPADRVALLDRIIAAYQRRSEDLAQAISREMGAPISLARTAQVGAGLAQLQKIRDVLRSFEFEEKRGTSMIVKEAIGVVGLITPWNWPLNQIAAKVGPAIAAGCTMVLKPSEIAPLNAIIFAEIMDEAGTPAGVFNLVNGDGPSVGAAMSAHPDIDMMSFTGSTVAGIAVAKASADTVKRVHQELGGKSANILLADADLEDAVTKGVNACFRNSGQSCNAPTRMFVPRDQQARAVEIAKAAAGSLSVGPSNAEASALGPVVSKRQFDKIQSLIESGVAEGATLVVGGSGRPDGLDDGYFVKPTIFADVSPGMSIAREEIFGPVLSIMPYDSVDEAVEEANNTVYGLASYIQGKDMTMARDIASRMRTGNVHINYPPWDAGIPFGGYKQSGNGREYAEFGLQDFLEIKGILGYGAV